jgi:hypothetical protein
VKIFRRVLVVYWIVFLALVLSLVLPPHPSGQGMMAEIKFFLARSLFILALPLTLGTITYPIARRYHIGMARSSNRGDAKMYMPD